MSRWHAPIDIYCERTSPEFWAEPVNALTTDAFLAAAAIGWQAPTRAARPDVGLMLLIVLTA